MYEKAERADRKKIEMAKATRGVKKKEEKSTLFMLSNTLKFKVLQKQIQVDREERIKRKDLHDATMNKVLKTKDKRQSSLNSNYSLYKAEKPVRQ